MDFGISDEMRMVVATVRDFITNELKPLEQQIEDDGALPDELARSITTMFCGTFDAKGTRVDLSTDGVRIREQGAVTKFVPDVDQVTFSGPAALAAGHTIRYVTERAVFELRDDGLFVVEISPGIDLRRDILGRVDFDVRIAVDVTTTNPEVYRL